MGLATATLPEVLSSTVPVGTPVFAATVPVGLVVRTTA
jgi:hypothetical protein